MDNLRKENLSNYNEIMSNRHNLANYIYNCFNSCAERHTFVGDSVDFVIMTKDGQIERFNKPLRSD